MSNSYFITYETKNEYQVWRYARIIERSIDEQKIIDFFINESKKSGEIPRIIAVSLPDLEKKIRDSLEKLKMSQKEIKKE